MTINIDKREKEARQEEKEFFSIVDAALALDEKALEKALKKNKIDIKSEILEETPLLFVINKANKKNKDDILKSVKILIKHKAKLKYKKKENTPLECALRVNAPKIVDLLLEKGVDIQEVNANNENALMWACYHDNVKYLKLFIEKGINIEAKDANKETAFHTACNMFAEKCIDFLVEQGAEVQTRNKYGRNILSNLCFDRAKWGGGSLMDMHNFQEKEHEPKQLKKAQKFAKKFIDLGVNINKTKGYKGIEYSPLESAIRVRNYEAIKFLLENNVDYKEDIDSLVGEIVMSGYLNIIKLLREYGLDIHAKHGVRKLSLVAYALIAGQLKIVQYLIDENVDILDLGTTETNAVISMSRSYLREEKIALRYTLIDYALNKGIDINSKSSEGKTALMHAAESYFLQNDPEFIEFLVARGADPCIEDEYGKTAIELLQSEIEGNSQDYFLEKDNEDYYEPLDAYMFNDYLGMMASFSKACYCKKQ